MSVEEQIGKIYSHKNYFLQIKHVHLYWIFFFSNRVYIVSIKMCHTLNLNFDEVNGISCATYHQTALPRKEPCHQTASPGKNLVTKRRHLGKNLVTKRSHLGTNPVTKAKNLRVGQDRSGQVRTGQGWSGQVSKKPCHQTASPRNKAVWWQGSFLGNVVWWQGLFRVTPFGDKVLS